MDAKFLSTNLEYNNCTLINYTEYSETLIIQNLDYPDWDYPTFHLIRTEIRLVVAVFCFFGWSYGFHQPQENLL